VIMNYVYNKLSFNDIVALKPSFEANFKLIKVNKKCNLHCVFDASMTSYSKEDLIMIDSKIPEILANIAIGEYNVKNAKENDSLVEYKIKDFLMYIFFRSAPEKIVFSNYGDKGFIALKNSKEILHFPNFNLSEFRSALLKYASFHSTLYKNQKEKSKSLKLKVTFNNNPVL